MKTLSPGYRRQLERAVVEARDVAEAGANDALEALAVHHHEPYGHMSAEQRKLRRRLRAHARQLGDQINGRSGSHGIDHLVHECAYEYWHGMLFARFLAENHLLIEPEMGVAITLDECEELAKEEGVDKWALAARFAHRMLPQVFRPDHPVFEVQLAREYRLKLEGLVEGLPADVFTATDALGWVYQYWQTKKKDEVNRSEVKIGADELPAVTQLFTEPYMVQFLLRNSLGAWWVSRHPEQPSPVDLTYLRKTEEGMPAAGAFEGWPEDLSEFRLLDPCCGSGHFLVAAFLMLVPMRMVLENLSAAEAVDAVLRDNLHGLELDQRCVAIAAFALALEAWRYPDAGGYRSLSKLNLAWCGQPVAGKREQWLALAEGDNQLEAGMAALYDTFRDAPILGSLIDPSRSVPEDMLTAGFAELQPLLERALREHAGEEEWEETAIAARGLLLSADLLNRRYDLIVTNVPYLGREGHCSQLKTFADRFYGDASSDLSTMMLERLVSLSRQRGAVAVVLPQNWWVGRSYENYRGEFLRKSLWKFAIVLGEEGWTTFANRGPNTILLCFENSRLASGNRFFGIDVSSRPGQLVISREKKEAALQNSHNRRTGVLGETTWVEQEFQFNNPGTSISLHPLTKGSLLEQFVISGEGCSTGDGDRFVRCFWEVPWGGSWMRLFSPDGESRPWGGREQVMFWESGEGELAKSPQARIQNIELWNKNGVLVGRVRGITTTLFDGGAFTKGAVLLCPRDPNSLTNLYKFLASPQYEERIRQLDPRVSASTSVLTRVNYAPGEVEAEALPAMFCPDPAEWLFHGNPRGSNATFHVATVRLLAYHWPAETDSEIELCAEGRDHLNESKRLYPLADDDGILCLAPVRGERQAHERLLQLLQAAWGDDWSDGVLPELLADAGSSSLDDWLRNQFFEEHCKLFHHRPFIWHIWDGRKRDGFHALVNYHKLAEGDGKGRRLLESLTYSYLGDWIARQQDGVKRGEGGAEDRLAAALELQKRLTAILEGEPPFDLFVRWKPIDQQPVGWEPDINDGVRLNIRPFMARDIPGGKKGAGILRVKPNIHWKKDRGKEPVRDQVQFPWFWNNGKFTGERVNDAHMTNAEKRAARDRAEGQS